MRVRTALAAMMVMVLVIGCRSGSSATPTASPTPTATPEVTATAESPPLDILPSTPSATPPSTPTPLPPATPSGLWTFDLGSGRQSLLYEGEGVVTSRIEDGGTAVSVLIADPASSTASRHRIGGDVIESYADRGLIVTSANGEHRFYLDGSDPEAPELVLEHLGEVVRLEGTRPRVGVSFSPSADRLLTVSERSATRPGEIIRTFSVHETADGRLRMQFEHRATLGSPVVANWSPSGRYVADEGSEGIFVRDTRSGSAWRMGASGSPRWSAAGDQLLVVSSLERLVIVNFPELDGIDLGPVDGPLFATFDRTGRFALVTSYADGGQPSMTRAYEATTGNEVASWPELGIGAVEVLGSGAAIALDEGIAVVLTGPSCLNGFVVHHAALGDPGRCIEGTNPRWSPNGEFLVFTRDREVVVLSVSADTERVIVRGTPPATAAEAPSVRWGPDGSWILIEWSVGTPAGAP